MKIIYNNAVIDRFFIKSMLILSPQAEHIESQNPNPGHQAIGGTFRFVSTDINDHKKVHVGSQIVQSSYHSLLPPYVHTGIGKSINYIESFNSAYQIFDSF